MARLHGVSYAGAQCSENLARRLRRAGGGDFHLGLLHCNLGGDSRHENYAPCTLDDLAAAGLDYWALGHVHNRRQVQEARPCVLYPGNTQGRSIRETGPRGCYLVQTQPDGSFLPTFLETDAVRWFVEDLSLAELADEDALLEALTAVRQTVREAAQGRPAVLRLRLVGRGDLHQALRNPQTVEDLLAVAREGETERPDFVWTEALQVATAAPVDLAQARAQQDFLGDFLRLTEQLRQAPEPATALAPLLGTLPGQRSLQPVLESFTADEWLQILAQAESLGLDRLLEGER